MNWTLQSLVGILMEAIIIGVLLRLNRSFGEYTESARRAHESNLLVQQENINLIDRVKRMQPPPLPYTPHHDKKEIA